MKRKVQQMIRYPEEEKIIRDDKIPEPVVMGTVGGEISMWGGPTSHILQVTVAHVSWDSRIYVRAFILSGRACK